MPMRSNIHRALVLMLALAGGPAGAHDFWLQPRNFAVEAGSEWPLALLVGHGAARQRSPIPLQRIERFDAIAADGQVLTLHGRLHPGRDDSDAGLRFDVAGTWRLVLETDDRAHSRLPALRFNDYLQSEGLVVALEQRRRTGRMDADGSEIYRRIAKALVRVGAGMATQDDAATRPIGLELEIVPERDPCGTRDASTLPVRVLHRGEGLAGATLKLTLLEDDAEPVAVRITDATGRATFDLPPAGNWLLNVVWTRALPAGAEADFATTFSSLAFGCAPAPGQPHAWTRARMAWSRPAWSGP
jgi:uncharacterized GH25 family protein